MYQDIYLTLLECKHCQAATFIKQVELDHGDWIATCRECGAQNVLAVTFINKVPVLAPPIRVVVMCRCPEKQTCFYRFQQII